MRFIWEESDIQVGRKISKIGIQETWMIGYLPAKGSQEHYTLVSMSDGMVAQEQGLSVPDLLVLLNKDCMLPTEILNLYLGALNETH